MRVFTASNDAHRSNAPVTVHLAISASMGNPVLRQIVTHHAGSRHFGLDKHRQVTSARLFSRAVIAQRNFT